MSAYHFVAIASVVFLLAACSRSDDSEPENKLFEDMKNEEMREADKHMAQFDAEKVNNFSFGKPYIDHSISDSDLEAKKLSLKDHPAYPLFSVEGGSGLRTLVRRIDKECQSISKRVDTRVCQKEFESEAEYTQGNYATKLTADQYSDPRFFSVAIGYINRYEAKEEKLENEGRDSELIRFEKASSELYKKHIPGNKTWTATD